jgi:diguanylate cyclase (GGDEF)-like protein
MAGEVLKTSQDRQLQLVTQHMAKHEIAGLPRNYELVHEAISGTDAALSREVLSLANPPQSLLDEIGARYQITSFVTLATPKSRADEIRLLLDLRTKMASGVTQKQGFTKVLETVARSLRQDKGAGPEDILAEIEFLSVSLSDAVVAETELEGILRSAADRLIQAETEANAARAITLRDRLTSLPNHAALAERLEALYGGSDERESALFLVSLTDLAHLAQVYGESAANRIVKKAATVFRKAIKKHDFLARTGRGEFAFLFREVNRETVHAIADRLKTSIADNLVFATSDGSARVTVSIGVALAADAFSPQQLRLQAAKALETAKASPRLTVVVHN